MVDPLLEVLLVPVGAHQLRDQPAAQHDQPDDGGCLHATIDAAWDTRAIYACLHPHTEDKTRMVWVVSLRCPALRLASREHSMGV